MTLIKALTFLSFIIYCNGAPQTRTDVHGAIREILDLIPTEEVLKAVHDHLRTDEGFKTAVLYVRSKQWTDLLDTIHEKKEWLYFRK